MQNNQQKSYGLIKLSKQNINKINASNIAKKRSNVFGDSDDSDDSPESASVSQFQSSTARRLAQSKISQAVELDPSIFEYDEVYDQMKSNESAPSNKKKTVEKKSRYISNMLKNKEIREKEQELREEKKIQKERELEGDQFNDKEAFVTSAYKQKIEQLRKTEEDIKQQENIENMQDVTKQNDLSSFYRSYYRNNMFSDGQSSTPAETEQQPVKFNKKSSNLKNTSLRERDLNDDDDNEESIEANIIAATKAERYAATASTNSKSHIEESKITNTSNNVTESSTEEANVATANEKPESSTESKESKSSPCTDTPIVNAAESEEPLPVKKPKIDRVELIRRMFTKRTVGTVFEEAKKRYLERKLSRQM